MKHLSLLTYYNNLNIVIIVIAENKLTVDTSRTLVYFDREREREKESFFRK